MRGRFTTCDVYVGETFYVTFLDMGDIGKTDAATVNAKEEHVSGKGLLF